MKKGFHLTSDIFHLFTSIYSFKHMKPAIFCFLIAWKWFQDNCPQEKLPPTPNRLPDLQNFVNSLLWAISQERKMW